MLTAIRARSSAKPCREKVGSNWEPEKLWRYLRTEPKHTANRVPDIGQPCLTPRSTWNEQPVAPLKFT
eukprot:7079665-Pyramimonas_sp.AAC.1